MTEGGKKINERISHKQNNYEIVKGSWSRYWKSEINIGYLQ